MPLITLVSSDGKSYQVETSVFKQSELISSLIEVCFLFQFNTLSCAFKFCIQIEILTINYFFSAVFASTHHYLKDLNLDIIPDAAAFPIPIRDVTGEVLEKVRHYGRGNITV